MKTKLRKSSKYLATAVFVAALVMNIFTSLTDPFGSSTVFADGTTTYTGTDWTGTGTSGTDGTGTEYDPDDDSCMYYHWLGVWLPGVKITCEFGTLWCTEMPCS